MFRIHPLTGPLITGGTVTPTLSDKEPEAKTDFVHPLYMESLRNGSTITAKQAAKRERRLARRQAKRPRIDF